MKKKAKILLSTINNNDRLLALALLYLKAYALTDRCLQEKVEIEIEEFSWSDSDDFILWIIQKYNPEIIGFSCYIWNIKRILSLSFKLKKINKDIKIILGGPQVSPIAEAILEENNQIDFIVRDEGEITFKELIKTLLYSERNFDRISGISYKYNGRIVNNANREIIPDLDSIPSVYASNLKRLENREVCLETHRGCIFRCHYCYYHKSFDKIRFFSIGRVKEDLSFLLKQKIKRIYLMDPVFNLDLKRAKEICKFIIQNNKNNIPFHTEIRAELVDKELAELFYKANFKFLEIGLQSTDKDVLELVNRKLNFEQFVYGIKLLKDYSLSIEIQLIFGLPGDTIPSFMNSLEQVMALKPKYVRTFRLMLLPGTEIWNNSKKLGMVYENEPFHRLLKSNSVSFSDIVRFEKIKNSLFLRNLWIIKYLCKDINIELLDFIKLWIDWVGEDKFLLHLREYSKMPKEKIGSFIIYLYQKYRDKINLNLDFYDALSKREIGFSIKEKMQL